MKMSLHSRARGTAIFMALLIIAIVASLASVLMRLQQIDIRRTQMMLTSEQSYLYAQGVIDWAKGALKVDLQNPGKTVWPMVLPPTPIADGAGTIAGILLDAQGLININNFSSTIGSQSQVPPQPSSQPSSQFQPQTPGVMQQSKINQAAQAASQMGGQTGGENSSATRTLLFNLLGQLDIQMNQAAQQQLASAITDWVSMPAGGVVNATDSYDQQYAKLNPPYRSPHAMMASVSELRTISGISPVIYSKLLPYIIALPVTASFNPAHAPPLLQKAAGYNAQQSQNSQASQQQGQSGQYFLLRADVYLHDQHLVLYTLIQRNNDPQKLQITQLWQSFGTL